MKFAVRMLLCLMISFSLTEFPIIKAHAQAGMISTGDAVTQMTRAQDEVKVTNFLSRTDVRDQMIKLGVNPEEAGFRVASLSDSELRKMASEIEHGTAGASVAGILIVVLIVILIIYFAKRI